MADRGGRNSERGTALLVVLLLVATMSVVTLGIVSAMSQAYRVKTVSTARTQAIWYSLGVEDFAASKLSLLLQANEGKVTHLTPQLNDEMEFVVEKGLISGDITDHSNCFNLNSLAQTEEQKEAVGAINAAEFYRRLLSSLELDELLVQRLVASLQDWVDEDNMPRPNGAETSFYAGLEKPYAAANGPLVTPDELLGIQGYSAEVFRLIRPYVCTRPNADIGVLNINTLTPETAPLLVPIFSGEIEVEGIRSQLFAVGLEPFDKVEDFLALPSFALIVQEKRLAELLDVKSSYFKLSGEVVYLDNATRYEAIFKRTETNQVELVRRRFGVDE